MTYHSIPDLSPYRKAITAAVGALLASIAPVWDLSITQTEAVLLVTVWATAFGVYQAENEG